MATLTNEKIKLTYAGLIKTNDSGAIGAVAKPLTDGLGNAINMEVLTGQINFPSGTVDFTGSTVNGLPIQPAGLINGVGASSLISSSALTTTPASAPLSGGIAIGNGAAAGNLVANAIAIGNNAVGGGGTAVGNGAQCFSAGRSVAYGANAKSLGNESVAIGGDALVPSNSSGGVALGDSATVAANVANAVAIGNDVTASKANTVSVKALEVQTDSTPTAGGIIMSDAGGVDRRINIDATGALQIDSTPVGGGAAGLVAGTAADSMISAASLTTNPASALCVRGIALGDNARAAVYANQVDGVAIGTDALSEATNSIAIGKGAWGQSGDEIAIGTSSHARLGDGIAIGRSSYAGNTGNIAIGKLANCDYQYTGVIALGTDTVCGANGAIAIGASVTAATVDTVTIKKLQMLDYATINFADDTAAATGGIPLGGVYHTSGALKIRIA